MYIFSHEIRREYMDIDLKNHTQFSIVQDMASLMSAQFTQESNVILMRRPNLNGDFEALAKRTHEKGSWRLRLNDDSGMESFKNMGDGKNNDNIRSAIDCVCKDIEKIKIVKNNLNLSGELKITFRSIVTYTAMDPAQIERRVQSFGNRIMRRFGWLDADDSFYDAHEFHTDGVKNPEDGFGRLLAAYTSPATEGVLDKDLLGFSSKGCPKINFFAKPFRFDAGDIWRHAARGLAGVQPFVHRGVASEKPRALLVVDLN